MRHVFLLLLSWCRQWQTSPQPTDFLGVGSVSSGRAVQRMMQCHFHRQWDHVSGQNRDFACQGSGQHDPMLFCFLFLRVGGSQQNGLECPQVCHRMISRWSFATGSLDPASFNHPLVASTANNSY
ncbi:hypothetical protein GGI35DRAFT_211206 [Trichoderma velutinum]